MKQEEAGDRERIWIADVVIDERLSFEARRSLARCQMTLTRKEKRSRGPLLVPE